MNRLPLLAATAALALSVTGVIATAQDGAARPDHAGGPAARMLDRFDSDGDGAVSRAEMEAAMAARFAEADSDGDGVLSPEEVAAAHEARRLERQTARAAMMIERFDTDGDGALGPDEAAAMSRGAATMFDLADSDDDGLVTQAELEELRDLRPGGRGRRHGMDHNHRHEHGDGDHERHGSRGPWWHRGGN